MFRGKNGQEGESPSPLVTSSHKSTDIVVVFSEISAFCCVQKRGTLSLITLLLTASGALLTAFSMAIFFDQSIWIWLPNLISGIEQLVLFVMCIVFVCHEWRETKTERPEKEKLLTAKNRTK
jgi:hypothetical protein